MERDKLLGTMDAKVWTDEFMATKARLGDEEFDHAMMLAWFANAIMAGFDEANRRAQRALDAEREKVRDFEAAAGAMSCKEIADKVAGYTQLQTLVRALPMPEEGGFPIVEVDGDYYVNHTSRFSTKDEAEAYAKLLAYRAALDAMTPAGGQG